MTPNARPPMKYWRNLEVDRLPHNLSAPLRTITRDFSIFVSSSSVKSRKGIIAVNNIGGQKSCSSHDTFPIIPNSWEWLVGSWDARFPLRGGRRESRCAAAIFCQLSRRLPADAALLSGCLLQSPAVSRQRPLSRERCFCRRPSPVAVGSDRCFCRRRRLPEMLVRRRL